MRYSRITTEQQGMTLIEILIALVIGLFLIGGVLQVFLSSKQTYRMQDNLSRLQENGRFAMDFISRDLRGAGFRAYPCGVGTSPTAVPSPINGSNNSGLGGTDVITIQTIPQTATPETNCFIGSIAYTIENGTGGQPSLYRDIDNNINAAPNSVKNELIEGIENMQILYGEDTNGDSTPEYYVPINTVVSLNQVVSIRVTLTGRTLDDNLTSTGDGRLRRIFTSTIAVRNRLP